MRKLRAKQNKYVAKLTWILHDDGPVGKNLTAPLQTHKVG